MKQKLSAMNYIRNNKGRISVLIVSLSLCFVATYLAQFILSVTEATFASILSDSAKRMQYIDLSGSAYELYVSDVGEENFMAAYEENRNQLAEELKKQEGVKDVFDAQILYNRITPPIGEYYFEFPCVNRDEIPALLVHMDAELMEGRLPEHPGEVVVDWRTMKNQELTIGDNFYTTDFTIVGILQCDYYFGCGIQIESENYSHFLCVLSDGSIRDFSLLLKNMGYKMDEGDEKNYIWDYTKGMEWLKRDVTDVIDNSSDMIFVGIIVILSVALFTVYTMYLRDRHNEWCLYSSIGYTRQTIYFSILRELLFSFGTAILSGGIMIVISMLLLNEVMVKPMGLMCRFFSTETVAEIFCSYIFLFGLLQLPVMYALNKIRTIDAMEEDLY